MFLRLRQLLLMPGLDGLAVFLEEPGGGVVQLGGLAMTAATL